MSERPSADFRLPISLIEDWKVLSEMAEGEFRGRCIQALCHLAAAELLEDQVLGSSPRPSLKASLKHVPTEVRNGGCRAPRVRERIDLEHPSEGSGDRDNGTRKPGREWAVRLQYPEALRESAKDFYGIDSRQTEKPVTVDTRHAPETRPEALPHISAHLDLPARHHAGNTDAHMADLAHESEINPDTRECKPDGTAIVASAVTIPTIHPDDRVKVRPLFYG